RAMDLEVGRVDAHRRARALALDGVHQRLAQVEQERIAELVGLRLVELVAAGAPPVHRVATEAVALEPGEDVAQRLVADLPDGARRQLQLVAVALEVPRLLEALGELAQSLQVLARLLGDPPLPAPGSHV